MKIGINLPRGKYLGLLFDKRPNIPTAGIVNRLSDRMYVPFLDYDNIDYNEVLKDLEHLNELYGLCSFAILCNSEEVIKNKWDEEMTVGNYNVIGLDKITFTEHYDMLRHTVCDWNFKIMVRWYPRRNWVLRVFPKLSENHVILKEMPILKDFVHFKGKCPFEHSSALKSFLSTYFNVKVPELENWDNNVTMEAIGYSTRSKKHGRKI